MRIAHEPPVESSPDVRLSGASRCLQRTSGPEPADHRSNPDPDERATDARSIPNSDSITNTIPDTGTNCHSYANSHADTHADPNADAGPDAHRDPSRAGHFGQTIQYNPEGRGAHL